MGMSVTGDLAQAFALRQRNSELKQQIMQMNGELASGVAADIADHLGGSYARLTSVERDLRLLDAYRITIAEADQLADVTQRRLSQIADLSTDFAADLVSADASAGAAAGLALAKEARLHFDTIVSSLNSQSAGRSLFAGDATDQLPLLDADLILAELDTVIAGAGTAGAAIAAVATWFDDPAGFEAFAYQGSATAMSPFRMSDDVAVAIDVRANDPALRETLKSMAIAAVSSSATLGLPVSAQGDMLTAAAERLLSGHQQLVGVQSRLGIAQEQIENWKVRSETERIGTEFLKGALIGIDPYESATRLEAAQFQLESLYAVTVRLSQMSLVNYLK